MKTIRTEEAKEIREHAIEFERKLIADWLKYLVSKEVHALITNGDYRHYFAHGTLPIMNGEFFKPFEKNIAESKSQLCDGCHGVPCLPCRR